LAFNSFKVFGMAVEERVEAVIQYAFIDIIEFFANLGRQNKKK
jgi:hypothetical protein